MELMDILTIAFASIIVLVIVHIAVFWVVRTLYPPTHAVVHVPIPVQPTFTQPAVIHQEPQQDVILPTYEAPLPIEAARKEEPERKGPPPPESTSIHGNTRVDPAVAQ